MGILKAVAFKKLICCSCRSKKLTIDFADTVSVGAAVLPYLPNCLRRILQQHIHCLPESRTVPDPQSLLEHPHYKPVLALDSKSSFVLDRDQRIIP